MLQPHLLEGARNSAGRDQSSSQCQILSRDAPGFPSVYSLLFKVLRMPEVWLSCQPRRQAKLCCVSENTSLAPANKICLKWNCKCILHTSTPEQKPCPTHTPCWAHDLLCLHKRSPSLLVTSAPGLLSTFISAEELHQQSSLPRPLHLPGVLL